QREAEPISKFQRRTRYEPLSSSTSCEELKKERGGLSAEAHRDGLGKAPLCWANARKRVAASRQISAVNFYEMALFREPDSDQRRSRRLRTAEITHRVEPSCLLLVAGRPALGGGTHNRARLC